MIAKFLISKVERMREDIDWLKETVNEIKKKHSTILSVPIISDGT